MYNCLVQMDWFCKLKISNSTEFLEWFSSDFCNFRLCFIASKTLWMFVRIQLYSLLIMNKYECTNSNSVVGVNIQLGVFDSLLHTPFMGQFFMAFTWLVNISEIPRTPWISTQFLYQFEQRYFMYSLLNRIFSVYTRHLNDEYDK